MKNTENTYTHETASEVSHYKLVHLFLDEFNLQISWENKRDGERKRREVLLKRKDRVSDMKLAGLCWLNGHTLKDIKSKLANR